MNSNEHNKKNHEQIGLYYQPQNGMKSHNFLPTVHEKKSKSDLYNPFKKNSQIMKYKFRTIRSCTKYKKKYVH